MPLGSSPEGMFVARIPISAAERISWNMLHREHVALFLRRIILPGHSLVCHFPQKHCDFYDSRRLWWHNRNCVQDLSSAVKGCGLRWAHCTWANLEKDFLYQQLSLALAAYILPSLGVRRWGFLGKLAVLIWWKFFFNSCPCFFCGATKSNSCLHTSSTQFHETVLGWLFIVLGFAPKVCRIWIFGLQLSKFWAL